MPSPPTITVLVVEDNPVERQLVSKILRNSNFEIVAVDCGEVVLDAVLSEQPDIILLDALLPDIDGFEVCQRLRAHPKGLHIPVIMLTGLDDVSSINRAYEVGATDFFTKPINHSLLVHRIRYLLRARLIMEELRVSKHSLASAQSLAKLGHWELDLEKSAFNISEEMFRLYGLERRESEQLSPAMLVRCCHPDDREMLDSAVNAAIDSHREARIEHRVLLPDGSIRYLELHMKLMRDEANNSSHILGLGMDISERKVSEQENLRLAYFDRLTGLPNRTLAELYVNQAIPRAHIHGCCVGLIMLDLDRFNRVNNSMGHSAGDAILQQLTDRLLPMMSSVDNALLLGRLSLGGAGLVEEGSEFIARTGADTYLLVLPTLDRQSGSAELFAKRVHKIFQQPFNYRGQELFITASLGIAFSESGSGSAEVLFQQADLALHDAKVEGRNEIRSYRGEMVARVSSHLSIQGDLRKAMDNGEFQLFYQPKISSSDQSVCGFEALVRWFHPVKGMVPPDQFITVAEETGQIVELGMWILEAACQQTKQWIDQGVFSGRVAVNVSARQFKESSIVEGVFAALERTGLAAENLELEMTEGVLMADPKTADMVARLRHRGISIALDDFGTGYSSLSYITRFPIDTIKIDRCFVQDITQESEKAAIVSAVCTLSHSLGFNVVAEGVETESELEVICSLCCDEIQGYFYCRPMSASDIGDWLQARKIDPAVVPCMD